MQRGAQFGGGIREVLSRTDAVDGDLQTQFLADDANGLAPRRPADPGQQGEPPAAHQTDRGDPAAVLGQFEQFGAEPDARPVALAGGRRMGSRSCWPMLYMDEGLAVLYSTRRSSRPPHALRRAISVPAKDVAHTLLAMNSWEAPDPVAFVRSN